MYYTHRGHGYLRCILLRLRLSKARIPKVDRQISLVVSLQDVLFFLCVFSFNYMMIAPKEVALIVMLVLQIVGGRKKKVKACFNRQT